MKVPNLIDMHSIELKDILTGELLNVEFDLEIG